MSLRRICLQIALLLFLIFSPNATAADNIKTEKPPSSEEVLAGVDERIEKYRKEDAVIRVLQDGKPLRNVHVEIEQVSHEFLFGCNIFMLNKTSDPKFDEAYRDHFAALMNFATLPFYWWSYEREKGKPDYKSTEEYIKWCRDNEIKVKGHPLVWNHEDPPWVGDDLDEIHRLQMQRVTDCVIHFKGIIDIWDVVNEPTDFERLKDKKVTKTWLKAGKIPFTLEAFARAKKANSDATLLINDYVSGEPYAGVIEQLIDNNGRRVYDMIGIQSHMHSGAWKVKKIWEVCERFSNFGVPLHFTEITILSGKLGWKNPEPWESTKEGEKYQAEHVEELYTVLFSHPSVEAITWWDFSDRGTWMKAPAGLIRRDGTPKSAYTVLKKLIKEKWWTKTEGQTDKSGKLKFRGFRGRYRVKVSYGHQIITTDLVMTKDGKNEAVVRVPTGTDN